MCAGVRHEKHGDVSFTTMGADTSSLFLIMECIILFFGNNFCLRLLHQHPSFHQPDANSGIHIYQTRHPSLFRVVYLIILVL